MRYNRRRGRRRSAGYGRRRSRSYGRRRSSRARRLMLIGDRM